MIEGSQQDDFTPEELNRALQTIKRSAVKFCTVVLGLKPFPYQVKFLEDSAKRIVVCAGRQVGKSLITAARALWFAMSKAETTTLIVSATQRQSGLMFDKILSYVEKCELLKDSVERQTRTLLRFGNDSQIVALPCGRYGNSLRGYTADQVIIDEAAFVPEEVINEAVMPMLSTTGGTAIMISTPYDRDHPFYKAFTSSLWSKYHFPTSENPLVPEEFLEEQRESIGEQRFRQEYMAEFVDDERSYFPMGLIRSCVHSCDSSIKCDYCEIVAGKVLPKGDLFAGYDPGGTTDFAALAVVHRISDEKEGSRQLSFKVVLTKSFRSDDRSRELDDEAVYTRFTAQVSDLHKQLHFNKVIVDSTGLGKPIVEHCKELKLPVEGLSLTAKNKEEIFLNLKIAFEQKKITVPNDLNLLSNLNCIEAERTRSGGYYFSHPRGTHDDLAYACGLALWAARKVRTLIMNKYD